MKKDADEEIKQFVADRDAALLSLDLAKINAHASKYGSPLIPDTLQGWAAIHKARTAIRAFPAEEVKKSKDWLAAHGFSHWADQGVRPPLDPRDPDPSRAEQAEQEEWA